MAPSPYQIRAVERSLDILEAFLTRKSTLYLDDICERCQLPKSTVFKILSVLEGRGYVPRTTTTASIASDSKPTRSATATLPD